MNKILQIMALAGLCYSFSASLALAHDKDATSSVARAAAPDLTERLIQMAEELAQARRQIETCKSVSEILNSAVKSAAEKLKILNRPDSDDVIRSTNFCVQCQCC